MCLSTHAPIDLGLFPLFGNWTSAALGLHLQGFVWPAVCISLGEGVAFLGQEVVELNENLLNKDKV